MQSSKSYFVKFSMVLDIPPTDMYLRAVTKSYVFVGTSLITTGISTSPKSARIQVRLVLTGTIQKTLDEEETAVCALLDFSAEVTIDQQIKKIRTPQAGVCSSLMWSLVVDELFDRLTAFSVYYIGYADDIAIITKGKFEGILYELIQMSLRTTNEWCHSVGLSINSEKLRLYLIPDGASNILKHHKDLFPRQKRLNRQCLVVVDELLKRLTAFGVYYIGYTDDIVKITKGKLEGILCELIQVSLRTTN
ncbi:hypothetical protein Trydic_g13597 [Trypoxylus dichotomus]